MSLAETDLLETLLNANPAPVILFDSKGHVLLFNPAAESLFGFTEQEARKLHATDLYHRAEDARRMVMRLNTSATGNHEVTVRLRNGERVPVRLVIHHIHHLDGSIYGTLGIFLDLRAERALQRRLDDAVTQVHEVERRANALQQATVVAYEMSQPLTAAMGNVEMLMMVPDLPPPATERLERTLESLERLARALNQLSRLPTAPTSR